jgi:hypothetical protein
VFDHLRHRVGDGSADDEERAEVERCGEPGRQRAGRARVATTVATELAASWKPLVKSKTSANTITAMTPISNQSIECRFSR